jgi:hypothetical protein
MKHMAGIIVMIVGVLIFAVGLIMYTKSHPSVEPIQNNNELEKVIEMAIADGVLTNNERDVIKRLAETNGLDYNSIIKDAEHRISNLENDSAETEIIDVSKKNGNDFEKYIAQKFDRKYFTIKEWAGDKYINGVYAETTSHPDILFEFKLNNQTTEFSVECKWRSKYYKNGIVFASIEQFKRYQDFEQSRNIPVFIAIGVGGKGGNPEDLYIVPLKSIHSNFISSDQLKSFKKNDNRFFYFDMNKKALK